jgi:formylglycine-generating enzyme required for sulfatase activity
MAGPRSFLALLAMALAVAVLPLGPRQPFSFDMVSVGDDLSVMRHEVTIAQWNSCVKDGGCAFQPKDVASETDDKYPVTGIGILDAQEFEAWARQKSGLDLRLPTLEEWYAFSGVPPYQPKMIFTDPRLAWAATYGSDGKVDPTLRPSGGFGANANGIADVRGNVWEWTSDCVAVMPKADEDRRCPAYFAVGEHEARVPVFVRDPSAGGCATGTPPAHLGLRLVKDASRQKLSRR